VHEGSDLLDGGIVLEDAVAQAACFLDSIDSIDFVETIDGLVWTSLT
jgi:hypothetical protein